MYMLEENVVVGWRLIHGRGETICNGKTELCGNRAGARRQHGLFLILRRRIFIVFGDQLQGLPLALVYEAGKPPLPDTVRVDVGALDLL
jgi:hypothetical protein